MPSFAHTPLRLLCITIVAVNSINWQIFEIRIKQNLNTKQMVIHSECWEIVGKFQLKNKSRTRPVYTVQYTGKTKTFYCFIQRFCFKTLRKFRVSGNQRDETKWIFFKYLDFGVYLVNSRAFCLLIENNPLVVAFLNS